MTSTPPVTELFAVIAGWAGALGASNVGQRGTIWRAELPTAEGDLLTIHMNATKGELDDAGRVPLPPFTASITSEKFLAVAVVSPFAGVLGGFSEDRLIAAFRAGIEGKLGRILST